MGLFGTNLEGSFIDTSVEMVMRDSSAMYQHRKITILH